MIRVPVERGVPACLVILAAVAVPRSAGANLQSGGWRVDERVLVRDFGMVTALARSPEGVHLATTGGLLTLDETFGGWQLPITLEDGYPTAPVTALQFDHRDGTLWMAAGGDLFQLDLFGRRFLDRLPVGRRVEEIVPAEAAGSDLFLFSEGLWWRFDTFGRDARRADPGAVRTAIDSRPDLRARRDALADPFFREGLDRVARDWYGRPLPVTDFVQAREAYRWWVATAGGFVYSYDDLSRTGERRAYGPVGRGMAAVGATDEELWFAPGEPLEERYGIAAASPDLQEWRVWRADSAFGGPAAVRTLLPGTAGVWAGGESGLHWLERGKSDWRDAQGIDRLLRPVLALAWASEGDAGAVWAGTSRGLVRLMGPTASADAILLPMDAVSAVIEADGLVWVGTSRGLFVSEIGQAAAGGVPSAAVRVTGPVSLNRPVGGLAATGDTVFAGLEREVWWRPGRAADWSRVDAIGLQRAPVTALALRDGTLWVGSSAGVTAWEMRGDALRRFAFGPDLPPDERGRTGVYGIAPVSGSEAWLATPAGALRIEARF